MRNNGLRAKYVFFVHSKIVVIKLKPSKSTHIFSARSLNIFINIIFINLVIANPG